MEITILKWAVVCMVVTAASGLEEDEPSLLMRTNLGVAFRQVSELRITNGIIAIAVQSAVSVVLVIVVIRLCLTQRKIVAVMMALKQVQACDAKRIISSAFRPTTVTPAAAPTTLENMCNEYDSLWYIASICILIGSVVVTLAACGLIVRKLMQLRPFTNIYLILYGDNHVCRLHLATVVGPIELWDVPKIKCGLPLQFARHSSLFSCATIFWGDKGVTQKITGKYCPFKNSFSMWPWNGYVLKRVLRSEAIAYEMCADYAGCRENLDYGSAANGTSNVAHRRRTMSEDEIDILDETDNNSMISSLM